MLNGSILPKPKLMMLDLAAGCCCEDPDPCADGDCHCLSNETDGTQRIAVSGFSGTTAQERHISFPATYYWETVYTGLSASVAKTIDEDSNAGSYSSRGCAQWTLSTTNHNSSQVSWQTDLRNVSDGSLAGGLFAPTPRQYTGTYDVRHVFIPGQTDGCDPGNFGPPGLVIEAKDSGGSTWFEWIIFQSPAPPATATVKIFDTQRISGLNAAVGTDADGRHANCSYSLYSRIGIAGVVGAAHAANSYITGSYTGSIFDQ